MNDIFAPAPVTVDPHSGLLRKPPLPRLTGKGAEHCGRRFLSPVDRGRGGSGEARDGVGGDSAIASPLRLARQEQPPRAILLGLIATWSERIRLRWQFAQMADANPHLIDDIGLIRRQVDAEIAKPFWRA